MLPYSVKGMRYRSLFMGEKGLVLGRCTVMAVSQVICMERNKRTFNHVKGEGGTRVFVGLGNSMGITFLIIQS